MTRIGYLVGDADADRVEHYLSTALALAKSDRRLEVVMAAADARTAAHVRTCYRGEVARWIDLIELRPPKIASRLMHGAHRVYADNIDFFASLDVLVTSDADAHVLTSEFDMSRLKIVLTGPDIGGGSDRNADVRTVIAALVSEGNLVSG